MVPNPTALRSPIDPEHVQSHRSFSCAEYDECLSKVLLRRWRSWSCERCSAFSHARELRAAEVSHEAALRPYA